MAIIAKFSNGFTDRYTGGRDVGAAWMITRKSDGKVLDSGHSLDRERARKTAESKLQYLASAVGVRTPLWDVPQRVYLGCDYSYLFDLAGEHGYDGRNTVTAYKTWAKEQNAKRKASIADRVNIEIVEL